MRSKWEYIRDACKELGYEEAAGIADEIEIVLKEIYGDTRTIAWMRDYISMKVGHLEYFHVRYVARTTDFCIACEEDLYCDKCRFAERTGGCIGDATLFRRFMFALEREGDMM